MSDHSNKSQATAEQRGQMRMGASPVPAPVEQAGPVELQAPQYLPGTLPIYILHSDPAAARAAAEAAAKATPPPPPQPAIANVDDPSQPPHTPTRAPGLFAPVAPDAPTERRK